MHHRAPRLDVAAVAVMVTVLAILTVYLLVHFDAFGSSRTSVTVGSGNAVSQTRSVAPFSGVELTGSNNVVIRVGTPQSVVVRADSNLVGKVTTVVRDGRLLVGDNGSFTPETPMLVTVTAPSLDALTISGSGNVAATGVETSYLAVSIPGSGNLNVSGTAGNVDVEVAGSGGAKLEGLTARDARAVLAGSGAIALTATNSLDARIAGSGTIVYAGNPPHVTKSITGSGVILAVP
jgi:membrane protein implicated in regulation of membrane protease activity